MRRFTLEEKRLRSFVRSSIERLRHSTGQTLQHEASSAAYENAQKQMGSILENIEAKTMNIKNSQSELEKNKLEALEAHKSEQTYIKEQEALAPLEQAARQKVVELKSDMDSERSQGSVLKAIMQAKKSNQIEGIYGRMGT
ncbi:hypothetical protein ACFE04_022754 [Oxalis oulophora]